LPCSLDVSGLASQNYALLITATDGTVGAHSFHAQSFALAGESRVLLDVGAGACAVCPPAARSGCMTAARSSVIVRMGNSSAMDRLTWRWAKGQSAERGDFGDPQTSADYALCIYGGTAQTLVPGGELLVPKSADKWRALGDRGWRYRAPAVADGVSDLLVVTSTADKSKAKLKASGARLPDLALPMATGEFPLTVQLVNGDTAACFESRFASSDVLKNDATRFKANAHAP
jgi:hypothetical protein